MHAAKFSSAASKKDTDKKGKDKEKDKDKHSSANSSHADNLADESQLASACWNNDLALVKTIIAKDTCNVNLLNERSTTLHPFSVWLCLFLFLRALFIVSFISPYYYCYYFSFPSTLC
jgi:hypothetical protein